jgi:glycosyltransferase involved in cell wall biosynthesis/GT2 family glycosyltransferase
VRLIPRRDHPIRKAIRESGNTLIKAVGLKRLRRKKPLRIEPGSVSSGGRQVICISGEPRFLAGHMYRVERCARSLADLGYAVDVVAIDALDADWWKRKVPSPAVVLIWRAAWNRTLREAVSAWRGQGARIIFDVDDYMFDPEIAKATIIDGIRSQKIAERDVVDHYAKIRETLMWADACVVPTAELAKGIELCDRPALISVNGFDAETYRVSREAVLRRRLDLRDGLVRIGYASGSRTHQRDFAIAAPAVANVLRERPECRLVLFRDARSGRELLDLGEFPEFTGLEEQVEWRDATSLTRLPEELARFDVNIAPLEVGNVYCEAKSELKYFEAALVGVPTVASPTQPFRGAIVDGVTGYLADDSTSWERTLDALVADAGLRARIGQAALHHVLHRYGPDGRRQRLASVMERVLGTAAESTSAFRLECLDRVSEVRLPQVPQAEVLSKQGDAAIAKVAVVVPLYNYASFVVEALNSVKKQTLDSIELIVVDDCSTDTSAKVAMDWIERNGRRFVSATLLRNHQNQGLPLTRNVGFAHAEAPFVFPLDADNTIDPRCLWLLLERMLNSGCSAAHPTLQRFGKCSMRHAAQPWSPDRLRRGNYIDAMALIRKSAWAHVGGYTKGGFFGWEDYELWCKFVESGLWSDPVPDAVAGYRVHGASMLDTQTNKSKQSVVEAIRAEHPWLTVQAA